MRKRFSELKGFELYTPNGVFGKITDLLIEDNSWNVRYLVVELKVNDLSRSRAVLIPPAAIKDFAADRKLITTTLSSQQILQSPPLDSNQPVSRRYEESLVNHYRWPVYWMGRPLHVPAHKMQDFAGVDAAKENAGKVRKSNLRSASEIGGYQINGKTGSAGVLKDLVVHIPSWTVIYATAESSSWLPRESSMFSTDQIESVAWPTRQVFVDLTMSVPEPIQPKKYPAHLPITGEPLPSQPFRTA